MHTPLNDSLVRDWPLRMISVGCAVFLWVGSLAAVARADDPPASEASAAKPPANRTLDPKAIEFFENRIRPILAERCLECHGAEKQKGNLRLDSQAEALRGGDSGPVLVAGKPEESLLNQVVGYAFDIKMPPKSKLPEREIADLTQWVKMGAPWPARDGADAQVKKARSDVITDEQRQFWAFVPPRDPPIPVVKNKNWPQAPLDHFILEKLEQAGLSPAGPAEKRTLIRRATLDLIGLPPTVEEVRAFLADDSPLAFARVVDRLLASPKYGERWGRHWLDVARYADSNGLDENLAYASAWRYRDYVIRAFNQDKPFDRFVAEQIAGDLLPPEPGSDPFDGLVATGFLCLGGKMLAEDDPVKMQMDIVDEQVDTVGRAFMGLTLGCARCHSHKYDPIPIGDYYSLAGIFKSTKTMENFSVVARWQERPLANPDIQQARDRQQQQIQEWQAGINKVVEAAQQRLVQAARSHVGDYFLAAVRALEQQDYLKSAKPIGAAADTIRERNARVIEAEDFARGNVLKVTDSYGEGIGVLVNKGELPNFTEYDVDVETAGAYQFEIRYAAAAARPVKLFINGTLVRSDVAGGVTGSWNPDTQTWEIAGFFPLIAGKNLIRLECPGPFPHIDKLLWAPAQADTQKWVALPPPADGYRLLPEFIVRWKTVLDVPGEAPAAALAPWHAWRMTGTLPAASTSTVAAALWGNEPPSRERLVARYAELLSAAETAWQKSQSNAGASAVTALDDPALESLRQLVYDPKGPFLLPPNVEGHFPEATMAELAQKRADVKALQDSLPKLPETMAVSEGTAEDLRIHLRGSHLTLGEQVPRRFPAVFPGEHVPVGGSGSGRRELAEWLIRPDHPLTSRVIVNRVWLWHFGEGLVRSPDNFGALGERPTHPELLDWLTRRFVEQGWSMKALHRLIMLSATYQMASTTQPQAAQADPENRLWWHANRRRLEAEALRDSILTVCEELDGVRTGTLLPTPNRQYVTGTGSILPPALYDSHRRSVYLPVVRSALYEMFQAFDFADPSVLNGRRDTTTVAPQALFMMNSPLVAQATKRLAGSLLSAPVADDSVRVQMLYERAYARQPTTAEMARAVQFAEQYAAGRRAQQVASDEARLSAWQALCRAVLSGNEFVYIE
ncbi:MAG: DUF1553 domain-containing protein [Planctomycetes bacterium]|nr:DUF1553 domain-containing protein [Planctomycetota bacterium]